ncbi:cytochrome P450 [Actinomadura rupiterrae]|uniref:cytochrome P450 n=1 Tax=Actinomadura rupiterrae TaxID=559627 RepID=UPI0020A29741|nr:cytochrome P450 [Actinomadura rupiterrae]MCP2339289.1 hypothetical protein [Actinomadura rupiterrae]
MTSVVHKWNVHPDHGWLRGKRPDAPVQFDEEQGLWNVYGHAECRRMLNDHETFSSNTARLLPVTVEAALLEGDLSQMDPPAHRDYRRLLSPAFTPRRLAALEERVAALTGELLDAMDGRSEIEAVADLAYPLPVIVIAELLGVPPSDREMFRGWADDVIESFSGFSALDEEEGGNDIREGTERMRPLLSYLAGHLAERRRHPREDLLTELALAEAGGRRLTDNEAVNIANILLITGHITTSMILGNTVLCLDADPEQAARVRADRSLVPGAVEEALRVLPPAAVLTRATNADCEIAGQRIPKDQLVFLWLGAANRDPSVFAAPEVFDPGRDPNPHFGFGGGIHFCIGAGLARIEARYALNGLLDRFPALRAVPDDPPVFFETPDMVGVRKLPLHTV